jgi:hypothetical protein
MIKPRQPIVWCWWDRDEPEDGMVGFVTAQDRNKFSAGGRGPFRRILTSDGHTISQMSRFRDMLRDNSDHGD